MKCMTAKTDRPINKTMTAFLSILPPSRNSLTALFAGSICYERDLVVKEDQDMMVHAKRADNRDERRTFSVSHALHYSSFL